MTLGPYLCSMIFTSPVGSAMRGLMPARNASLFSHIIPSASIQLKSGSSHLLAAAWLPLARALKAARSAASTGSSPVLAAPMPSVASKPAPATAAFKIFLVVRFMRSPFDTQIRRWVAQGDGTVTDAAGRAGVCTEPQYSMPRGLGIFMGGLKPAAS